MEKKKLIGDMPEFLSTEDLVVLGIYSSTDAAWRARRNKCTPPYIKLHHRILYPKQALIDWFGTRTVRDK